MFKTHQTRIAQFAQGSPDNLARTIYFVILTIRMPLNRVPADMRELDRVGERARCLWGHKRKAYQFVRLNASELYNEALYLNSIPNPYDAERELLKLFATIPGIGLVKAGFIVQLAFGLAGCLDGHNAARYNLSPNDLRSNTYKSLKSFKRKNERIDVYLDICHALGGCEVLWDTWCQYVAGRGEGISANHVSALHCEAIGV